MSARKQWLSLLGIVLGGTLFGIQLANSIKTVLSSSVAFNPWLVVVAIGAVAAAFVAQIAGWIVLMRSLEIRLRWADAFSGYVLSFIPRYLPGTIWGYLSRGQWMAQSHGVIYRITGLASIVEIVVSVSSAISVIVIFGSLRLGGIERWVAVALAFLMPLVIWFCLRQALKVVGIGRWLNPAPKLNRKQAVPLLHWVTLYGLYVILWTCYGCALWAVGVSLGSNWSYGFAEPTAIFALAWTIGFLIIIAPSGLGVRELALTSLLSSLIGFSSGQASLVAVTMRLVALSGELLLIICALGISSFEKFRTLRQIE